MVKRRNVSVSSQNDSREFLQTSVRSMKDQAIVYLKIHTARKELIHNYKKITKGSQAVKSIDVFEIYFEFNIGISPYILL